MMTDLIKREDALATIETFKRDFEQSWKVQFSADIRALPAVDLSERIEELERENAKLVSEVNIAKYGEPNFAWSIHNAVMADLQAKLAKAVEYLRKIAAYTHIGTHEQGIVQNAEARIACTALAELEGKND